MPRGEEAGGAAGGGPTGDFWTSLLLRCFLRFFSIFSIRRYSGGQSGGDSNRISNGLRS